MRHPNYPAYPFCLGGKVECLRNQRMKVAISFCPTLATTRQSLSMPEGPLVEVSVAGDKRRIAHPTRQRDKLLVFQPLEAKIETNCFGSSRQASCSRRCPSRMFLSRTIKPEPAPVCTQTLCGGQNDRETRGSPIELLPTWHPRRCYRATPQRLSPKPLPLQLVRVRPPPGFGCLGMSAGHGRSRDQPR